MTDLAICRYASFHPAMGVPVQTSIGRPKWPLPYDLTEDVGVLKPWGLFGKDLTAEEFTAHYRARLEKVGVDALRRLFETISARHGGSRLVLLCFEKHPHECHRGDFADWWLEVTGQIVPELSILAAADGTAVIVCHDQSGQPPRREVQR
jgi:hypothetical protein